MGEGDLLVGGACEGAGSSTGLGINSVNNELRMDRGRDCSF